MIKKTLLLICAIVTFVLGVCAVFVWFNAKSNNHTTTTKTAPELIEKCVEAKNFPGLSQEISKIKKGKMDYFPKELFGNEMSSKHSVAGWYGKHLRAMEEKSLLDISDKNVEVYRFLWLRSFHHPVFVRVERKGDSINLFSKELDGAGGYEPGKILQINNRSLSEDKWCEFINLIEKAEFWKLPTYQTEEMGNDGAQWILEGVKDNRYHIVDRWTPGKGNYREVGLFLLKLSDFDFDTDKNSLY
jgi:hypothetical protein